MYGNRYIDLHISSVVCQYHVVCAVSNFLLQWWSDFLFTIMCSESPHGTLLLPATYCSFLFKNGELISVLNQEKQPLQILKYHFNFLDSFELYESITKLYSCELIFKKCSMCIKYSSIHVVRNLQYRYT